MALPSLRRSRARFLTPNYFHSSAIAPYRFVSVLSAALNDLREEFVSPECLRIF
jgi:hypothetical protein